MRTPLRWFSVNVREFVAIFRAVAATATEIVEAEERLKRRPKVMPVIIPGRPQDFGR
ncbi:MAG TPA: hypothetical protein VF174_08775 [Micromonosporaceae bacterium]